MNCNYIPQVKDNEGNLHDSVLFSELLSSTGDRMLTDKVYKATFTSTFKNWFGNSPYVNDLGEPRLYQAKDGSFGFINEQGKPKMVKNTPRWTENLTEDDILNDLRKQGIINLKKFYGEYLLPRPFQGSFSLEDHYRNRPKPETELAARKIRELNQQYRDRYGIMGDVITTRPFGATQAVRIDTSLLDIVAQRHADTTFAPVRRPNSLPFDNLRRYKENLISNLKERLVTLSIERRKVTSSDDIVRIIKTRNVIEDRIKKLTDELIDIDATTVITDLNPFVDEDLIRMERLAQSKNYDDLEEAYNLAEFYSYSNPSEHRTDHNIFQKNELYDANGVFIHSQTDMDTMISWATRANQVKDSIIDKRNKEVLDYINSDKSFLETYGGKQLTMDELKMSKEGLKDINWFDMMLMDATNGIFSSNGVIPQMHAKAVASAHSMAESAIKEKQVKLLEQAKKAETVIGRINNGMYRLGRFIVKPKTAVSWDMFFQRDIDGTKTGNLLGRYSRVWEDAERDMLSRVRTLEKNKKGGEAKKLKKNWYKANSLVLDITKIPEVMNFIADPANGMDFLFPHLNSVGTVTPNITGNHLKEITAKQIELLKQLKYAYEARIELELEHEGVMDYNALSLEGKEKLRVWLIGNSPVTSFNTIHNNYETSSYLNKKTNRIVPYNILSSFDYNIKIPRTRRVDEKGNLKEATGYYDTNFGTIDSSPELYDFHQTAQELIAYHVSVLPADQQKNMAEYALGLTPKIVSDILFDPDRNWFHKLKDAVKQIIKEKWTEANYVKVESSEYKGKVDILTNKKVKGINTQLVQGLRNEIGSLFTIEKVKFITAFNNGTNPALKLKNISKNTRTSELLINQNAINILSEYLSVAPTMSAIKAKMQIPTEYNQAGDLIPSNIPVGRIINNFVTNKVVETTTSNLPRALVLFSDLAADYAAKKDVKPFSDAMKAIYMKIKQSETQNTGDVQNDARNNTALVDKETFRTNAMRQFESQYERAVLGYYEVKHSRKERKYISEIIAKITGKPSPGLKDKHIYFTEEEQIKIAEINAQLATLGTTAEDKALAAELEAILSSMGYVKMLTKRLENLLNYIRVIKLGWNPDSALTNFLEGQIGNEIAMSNGLFYPTENWYKATRIVRLARRKAISKHLEHPMATMTSILMNRYNVLQDSRNELQKAGFRTSHMIFEKLDPMLLNQSVEYLNQAPILVTALMTEKITDENGNISSVFDAMDMKTGKLKPQWRRGVVGKENVENWENMSGEAFHAFKSQVNKCIVNVHGDYERLRGNLAKTGLTGKAGLMFKGWLPRALYARFAVEQYDIEGRNKFKGRYRSHTRATASLHGAIAGLTMTAPFGVGLIGGAIGAIVGASLHGKYSDTRTDLTYLDELGKSTFMLARKMLGVPLNRLLNKEILHSTNLSDVQAKGFKATRTGNKFTEIDQKNMLANLTEMSITLMMLGITLLTKAFLFNDEDDEDDKKRMLHNYLANRSIMLSQQATMYTNITEMWENNATGFAVLAFVKNCIKLTFDINKAFPWADGNNIDDDPANMGGNRIWKQARRTLLPAPLQPVIGFEAKMKKQFVKTPYDKWFNSKYKNTEDKINDERKKAKADYIESGKYTSSEIDKMMETKYPTLTEMLNNGKAVHVIKQEEIDWYRQEKKRRNDVKKMKVKVKDAKIIKDRTK